MRYTIGIIVIIMCVIIPIGTAQNNTATIITIKPEQPKIGELVQIQVSYNVQNNNVNTYFYTTENSQGIKFVNVRYLGTTGSNGNDRFINVLITLRALKSGVIKIPAIIENGTVSISVPNLYVKSTISVDNTTTILNYVGFPWLSLLHFLLILLSSIVFIYLTIKIGVKKYLDIKKQYYVFTNKHNVRRCIVSSKRLLFALTKSATAKFRQRPINTNASYIQMVLIIRRRIRFLYGKQSQSFTHKELQHIVFKILFYDNTYKISHDKIELFFIAASEALYGHIEHDIMVRRTHCQLLLDMMKASVCYEKKQQVNEETTSQNVSTLYSKEIMGK